MGRDHIEDKGQKTPSSNYVREREGGREGGLTLFTDTLCELITLHILFRFM